MEAMQLPSGFRFMPSDEVLAGDYLFKKLKSTLLPLQSLFVPDADLYGDEEPWQLFQRFAGNRLVEEDDLYFFTKLKKKGSRFERRVGPDGGSWHGVDSGKNIYTKVNIDGEWVSVEAAKRTFSYRNSKSIHSGRWIMHEFSLPGYESVLCRLRKNFPVDVDVAVACEKKGGSWRPSKKRKVINVDGSVPSINSSKVLAFQANILADDYLGGADAETDTELMALCAIFDDLGPQFSIDDLLGDI